MPFPCKDYNRLKSLRKIWGFSQEDMFYAMENAMFRVCIWLPLRYVERVAVKEQKLIYEQHEHKEGFVGVRIEDCRRICSTGRAKLRVFNSICGDNHILRLAYEPPQPSICVRLNDLIVLREDQQQFEEMYGIKETEDAAESNTEHIAQEFIASDDFRYVKLDTKEYHLGDVQARIIEQLYDASQSQRPWIHGKTLIYESGSNALRLRDLFKNKRTWRGLIISNERGYYRLNLPLENFKENPANTAIKREYNSNQRNQPINNLIEKAT